MDKSLISKKKTKMQLDAPIFKSVTPEEDKNSTEYFWYIDLKTSNYRFMRIGLKPYNTYTEQPSVYVHVKVFRKPYNNFAAGVGSKKETNANYSKFGGVNLSLSEFQLISPFLSNSCEVPQSQNDQFEPTSNWREELQRQVSKIMDGESTSSGDEDAAAVDEQATDTEVTCIDVPPVTAIKRNNKKIFKQN